ncbi:hypothetical protein FK216_13890 [Moraxellaceae bacterium AER2_44_116]|nr:hypothetical protein [Moraxellaceae bacterium]TQC95597.1 hypothetical protein FK216_13890 [Moraxellaceae bacterium AER2_44_116]
MKINLKLHAIVASVLLVFSTVSVADDIRDLQDTGPANEWRLIKNDARKSIKAWDKRDDDKRYRSFKLDLMIDAPLETVARVYFDVENYPRWFWEVQEAKLLKKVSSTEFYYYLVHRAPVAQPKRDVIIHALVEPMTAKKPYVLFKLNAVPDYFPAKPPLVRMRAEDMVIKWTPMPDNQTREEVEGYIDPGGDIPAWAINAVQRQAPYYTVIGLQRMVKNPKFVDVTEPLPFKIRE